LYNYLWVTPCGSETLRFLHYLVDIVSCIYIRLDHSFRSSWIA